MLPAAFEDKKTPFQAAVLSLEMAVFNFVTEAKGSTISYRPMGIEIISCAF